VYKFIFAAMTAVLATPVYASTVYYVDIVNTSANDVVSFEVASAGSDRFHSVLLGNAPLQGGGEAATIAIRKGDDDGCRRDLRIGFSDGRVLTHRGFDICHYRTYHAERYLRTQTAEVDKP